MMERNFHHESLRGSFLKNLRVAKNPLYFQWDLVRLSKDIIYTGVPALLFSSGAILYLNGLGTITGSSFGLDHLLLTVPLLATFSLVAFLALVSYVVRVATVAQETLAIGPLSLR